ncbi:MAG: hypothetical protein IIB53_15130 [Planctomycetes bacterium]|nr:hypothetical protein [Planctomycetota bacterium]MCH8259661.1 hypothetical protein [Planctomycetota bacterium]
MKSRTTERFRKSFAQLPTRAQRQARQAYQRFRQNPNHPSLRLKKVHSTRPIYSVRISLDHRALGVREGDEMIWFWIGSHGDYEKLLTHL